AQFGRTADAHHSGRGHKRVKSQSPRPGTKVRVGTNVTLQF
ncbi:MAG: PASTA domain-containing protein, partial [Acidimicrobiia bacterium]